MKKILLFSFFIFHFSFTDAQYALYAVTGGGGVYDKGLIFRYDPITNLESVLFSFNGSDGEYPEGNLFLASNGLLYGMTEFGGIYNLGTIFSFDIKTNTETVLVNLNGTNGGTVNGLNYFIQGKDSLLYGTTWAGGSHQAGVLFSYNITTGKDSIRLNFDTTLSGCAPCNRFYQDTETGIMYGTTELGGKYGQGVLYSFNPTNNKDSVLINFDTGGGPYGSLSGFIRASNGLLYSMAPGGGKNKVLGVIYSYNIATGILDTLFSFNTTDGASPWGSNLLQLSNGLMYGMTMEGGSAFNGTIFSFDTSTNTEQVLVNFGTLNGGNPKGTLIQDPDNGLLYGMTYDGGAPGEGNAFSYDVVHSTYMVLFNFTGSNGAYPDDGFTLVDTLISTGGNKINTFQSNIYPNPNNGHFTIVLQNVNEPAQIEIYNVLGEEIYKAKLNTDKAEVNLNGQPQGIYFYRVLKGSGGLVGCGKLIVEK